MVSQIPELGDAGFKLGILCSARFCDEIVNMAELRTESNMKHLNYVLSFEVEWVYWSNRTPVDVRCHTYHDFKAMQRCLARLPVSVLRRRCRVSLTMPPSKQHGNLYDQLGE